MTRDEAVSFLKTKWQVVRESREGRAQELQLDTGTSLAKVGSQSTDTCRSPSGHPMLPFGRPRSRAGDGAL
jgi:hypothetical protein